MFLARQLEGSVARRLGGAHGSAARMLGSFRLDETKARIVETTGRRAILVAVRDDVTKLRRHGDSTIGIQSRESV